MNATRKTSLPALGAHLCIAALVATSPGCGGQKGTLTVTLVVPQAASDDPFAAATKVHVMLGDPAQQEATAAVTAGKFDLQLQFKPPSAGLVAAVRVEALDANGNVVGRGKSPVLTLLPQDESIAVYVGPVGKVVTLKAALTKARIGFAAAPVPRLGPMFVGGKDATGAPVTDAEVYQIYEHNVLAAAPLPTTRPGAYAVGVDRPSTTTGNLLVAGGATGAGLLFFDPLTGSTMGAWSTVASDATFSRDTPAVTVLPDGNLLVSGGRDDKAMPLASAFVLKPTSSQSPTPTAGSLVSPRFGHTGSPVQLKDGAGAILFGGVTGSGAVAEYYLSSAQTFTLLPTPMEVTSRTGHTATVRSTGEVLIVGGKTADGTVTRDAILIDPKALTVTVKANFLATARTGHSTNFVGGNLLVCGGWSATGTPLSTCEQFVESSLVAATVSPSLPVARADHNALELETGTVLFVGGVGPDGKAGLTQLDSLTY